MPVQWLPNYRESGTRLLDAGAHALRETAKPERARRLRQVLAVLLAMWGIGALARLFWALLPAAEVGPPPVEVLNPVSSITVDAEVEPVDIERLVSWHLFGEADAETDAEALAAQQAQAQAMARRDGIEEGARETRLDLVLRGVLAATQDGLGHAVIEYRREQQVYAVEDQLPVAGRVFLAKVMPQQVVLDNGGTYELLRLYEETELSREASRERPAASALPGPDSASSRGVPREVDRRDDPQLTRVASEYRDRVYANPQSLASVVQVSAVREQGALRGYRVRPGQDAQRFKQLGFEAGDMVVGINGIMLDDPANAMRLYQVMRSAPEAVFELQRGDELVTLSINLEPGDG